MREEIIKLINDINYIPLKTEEMAMFLKVENMPEFIKLIDELEKDMYICKTKKNRIIPPNRMGLFVGRFVSHRKGFGFVVPDGEGVQDLYIQTKDVNGAMHNDRVLAEITREASGDKRAEGKIIKVIKREITQIVGTFIPSENYGFVRPFDKQIHGDIHIARKYFNNAKENDRVVVEVIKWAEGNKKPEGMIIEVLGNKDERYVEIESIVKEHGLPDSFPSKVMEEADFVAKPIPEEELERRLDLREEIIFTIDGVDAKDLDDAISVDKLDNGNYKLGVHIADVTHYVKEKSKLDKEALKRATSVYLVDKVIPMLPPQLSNDVCSLHPNTDKLTLSCIMEIDKKGKVVKYDIKESVINTVARLNYTEVSDMLESKEIPERLEHVACNLFIAEELAKILMKKRDKRGALDFDFPEAYIQLDQQTGDVLNIQPYERRIANRIIEEFMLVTNETVSEHFYWLGIPFVYRIHETPSSNKMEALNKFVNTYGYFVKGDTEEVHPKAIQAISKGIKGKKEEKAINTIILRSLKQAKYSPECVGHFGLAAKYYSHFTSPIRRYPDLQIHRIIKEYINGGISNRRIEKLKGIVDYSSVQSSEMERKAEVAERDIDKFYKCVYMRNKVGQEFEGMISSTTQFGIYVELPDTVEGMIKLETMEDDFYVFDENSKVITGKGTNKQLKIGDEIKVKLESVDVELREITFSVISK